MYAILGTNGRVGGTAAQTLLNAGAKVRAVVRDPRKVEHLAAQGADVAIADWENVAALTQALVGVEGAFVMVPPHFAPEPNFPEARAAIANLVEALAAAKTPKVVFLSSIGAQHDRGTGLILQCWIGEQALQQLPASVAMVRAAWFMENHQWDIPEARATDEFKSYLSPLDRSFPLVATEDIGRVVAETLLSDWQGKKIVELEGPRRYSPNDLAQAISKALGKDVQAIVPPRDSWTELFEAAGMPKGKTGPRAEMVDGFNSGWIEFEGTPIQGQITLEATIAKMAEA